MNTLIKSSLFALLVTAPLPLLACSGGHDDHGNNSKSGNKQHSNYTSTPLACERECDTQKKEEAETSKPTQSTQKRKRHTRFNINAMACGGGNHGGHGNGGGNNGGNGNGHNHLFQTA